MSWIQTRSGRAFDLLEPKASEVDFVNDVAPALARVNRFSGHAGVYSVAQHCFLGARHLAVDLRDTAAAAEFLLHDAHEAYIGDITGPVVDALELIGVGASGALRFLKGELDAAIFAAAGLKPGVHARKVREMDLRMLLTERALLLGAPPKPWDDAIEALAPLPIAIERWTPEYAARAWLGAFSDYVRPGSYFA